MYVHVGKWCVCLLLQPNNKLAASVRVLGELGSRA